MITFVVVSVISGILFGILDAVININPLGQKINEVYKPIARTSINPFAGVVIDLFYGFIMAGVFLLLYASLPGGTGLLKGLSYGVMAWFFRVVMQVAAQWVMFTVPARTLLYNLLTGLGEQLILGILYGLTLKPGL